MIIRPFQSQDYEKWLPLWQGYLECYNVILAEEVTVSTWGRLTDANGPFFGLAAIEEDENLVGFAHCLMHLNTWDISPRCYLEDLFVSPDARGGGHGRALLEAVYQRADKEGANQVYWFTNHDNVRARGLYDKMAKLSDFVRYDRN